MKRSWIYVHVGGRLEQDGCFEETSSGPTGREYVGLRDDFFLLVGFAVGTIVT